MTTTGGSAGSSVETSHEPLGAGGGFPSPAVLLSVPKLRRVPVRIDDTTSAVSEALASLLIKPSHSLLLWSKVQNHRRARTRVRSRSPGATHGERRKTPPPGFVSDIGSV